MKNPHIDCFVTYLENLPRLLKRIVEHEEDADGLLQSRLTVDMFPLGVQAQIAINFALRASFPLAGRAVPTFSDDSISVAGLQEQIGEAIQHLQELDQVGTDLSRIIEDRAGPKYVALRAADYLTKFAYPNFFFHLSMVYAIARANGVPLSKGDFDGIHAYPTGFSFEE